MATLKSIKNKYLSTADGATLGVDQNKDNVSLLAFKMAAADSIAKFDMRDGFFDDFQDASGIDASASTDEIRNASNYYSGGVSASGATTGFTTTGANTWTAPSPSPSTIEVLVVGGGGGGGRSGSGYGMEGGAGAGGVVHHASYSVTAGVEYDITVGAGGAGGTSGNGSTGSNSVFNVNSEGSNTDALTGKGGGYGGGRLSNGGSGGHGGGGGGSGSYSGGSSNQSSYTGATTYGYAGQASQGDNGGGGGGAANSSSGGDFKYGRDGVQFSNFTSYGNNGYFAAGGGGGRYVHLSNPAAGCGGYGDSPTRIGGNAHGTTCGTTASTGAGQAGTANTGSGGGGGVNANGGSGGSGFVGIHYDAFTSYNDMTLISNASTADSTPTTGDIVLTYTNGAGTATVNTDLKAYISRDGGTTWTQGTLVSEGTTGGDTILAARRVDISGQPAGTSMRYKVTTHNQSSSKETRVMAASLAWA